jgi:hydroxymethylbilane synthase
MKLRIGTRSSKLALKQTEIVISAIKQHDSAVDVEIIPHLTKGDRLTEGALRDIYGDEGKAAFTKELQQMLLENKIDIVVHSMKDVAGNYKFESLTFGAFLERDSAFDCIVSKLPYKSLEDFPKGSVIGTVSLRRKNAILRANPNVIVENLRGNVQTRITKLRENFDAIIMAEAAINRSGEDLDLSGLNISRISPDVMVPAACQGLIGVECRSEDKEVIKLLSKIDHKQTRKTTEIEREFLYKTQGDCHSSIGAYAYYEESGKIGFITETSNEDGSNYKRNKILI